jgi:hypothetical protein
VRYARVEQAQCERFRQFLMVGVPAVAALALAMPFLHLGAVALAPIFAVIHLVVARWYLTSDGVRLMGATRRRFNRWLARFAFLWLGVAGYAAMVTPVVGILVGIATFTGLTSIVHIYAHWSLGQEYRKLPLMRWERILLMVLFVVTLFVLGAVIALAAVLGWSVTVLTQWISSNPG